MALFRASGGKVILPPDIRALGDLESDEPPPGAEAALAGLSPAIEPTERLGALALQVKHFYSAKQWPLPPGSAIAAAQELSRLLDSAALSEDVKWGLLPTLVQDKELAAHCERVIRTAHMRDMA